MQGKDLFGVAAISGIVSAFDAPHGVELRSGKHQSHLFLFLNPDPVFPCNTAAERHANLQNFPSGLQHSFRFAGPPLIERDTRMEVAIAGMSQVDNRQTVTFANLRHAPQRFGQLCPWHAAVDDISMCGQPF
jgi:hypothetical protein